MNSKVCTTVLIAASLFLSACGGGGGSSSGGPPPTPSYTACPNGYTGTAPNCVAAQTTTAWGVVVDDPSGNPLAGVPVKIEPWIAAATPLPSPQTTTAPDGSFTFTAPNGHYLLVIGSDSSNDTTRPTIHDNITLGGGTTVLKAPTLLPEPTITKPPMETNGDYRLMTIEQTAEAPCFYAFNSQRTSLSLPVTVLDEWLTENSREMNTYRESASYNVNNPGSTMTTGNAEVAGDTSCASAMPLVMNANPTYTKDSRTLWFSGNYSAHPATGVLEFPIDPRATPDPNFPNWP